MRKDLPRHMEYITNMKMNTNIKSVKYLYNKKLFHEYIFALFYIFYDII